MASTGLTSQSAYHSPKQHCQQEAGVLMAVMHTRNEVHSCSMCLHAAVCAVCVIQPVRMVSSRLKAGCLGECSS